MSQEPKDIDEQLTLPDFSAISPGLQKSRLPRRRQWWRQRRVLIPIAILLLLAVVAGIAIPLIRGHTSTVTYQYQSVTQGDFSLSVEATGPVQSAVYNLVFSGSGKISEIDVQVGQTVKANQLLAKLDLTSLQDAVDAAQAGVLTAQTAVSDAQNNLGQTEASSNASIKSAQDAIGNAQASLTNTLAQSNSSIAGAQTTLNNDMASLGETETQSRDSISAAQSTLNNDQISLSNTRKTAQAQLKLALTQERQAIAACTTPTPTPTPGPTPTPSAASTSSSAASTSSSDCVRLAEEQYNQTVATVNATVADAEAKVTSDQKQLALTTSQANANVTAAQNKITSDQQALSSTQAQANSNNTSAQNQVNTAMNQLATTQASAGASATSGQGQVNSAQDQLQTALVQLQTAQHNLNNNVLRAPHAGIVTTINGTVGGTPGTPANSTSTSSSGNTFIQISDTSSLQVLASVNESDTTFLKVGDPVQFTVSAYSNRLFSGTVGVISPSGTTVSNVVTYPVTINVTMSNLQGAVLLPGMTASVTIVVVQRPNAVLIPVNAVNFARTAFTRANGVPPLITSSQASTVLGQARQMLRQFEFANPAYLQDNPTASFVLVQSTNQKTIVPVPIVLGLTDDTFYEVLSGLTPGQVVVVGAQTNG